LFFVSELHTKHTKLTKRLNLHDFYECLREELHNIFYEKQYNKKSVYINKLTVV